MRRIRLEKVLVEGLTLKPNDAPDIITLRLENEGWGATATFDIATYRLDDDDCSLLRDAAISDGELRATVIIEVGE